MASLLAQKSRELADLITSTEEYPAERAQLFNDLIKSLYPLGSERIAAQVQADLDRGVAPSDAFYLGILEAVNQSPGRGSLQGLLAAAQSAGLGDFGISILVIAIISACASIALSIWGIYEGYKAREDAANAMRDQRNAMRAMAMTMSETDNYARLIAETRSIQTEQDAIKAFKAEVAKVRYGRSSITDEERRMFVERWREYRDAKRAIERQAQELRQQATDTRAAQSSAYAQSSAARMAALITNAESERVRQERLSLIGGLAIPAIAVGGVAALYFLTR